MGIFSLLILLLDFLSTIVDNVPLVAGAIEMYPKEIMDSSFWEFLAYCAGTGGSVLIIGSAAGVAIMGILKIDFFLVFKKNYFSSIYRICFWCVYLLGFK